MLQIGNYLVNKYKRKEREPGTTKEALDVEVLGGASLTLGILSLYSRFMDVDPLNFNMLIFDASMRISEDIVNNVLVGRTKHYSGRQLRVKIKEFFEYLLGRNYSDILYKESYPIT